MSNSQPQDSKLSHMRASRAGDFRSWFLAITVAACVCGATCLGFWLGNSRNTNSESILPLLAATSSSTQSMAVATGAISEETEGIFFLDYITGDLQCLVYYPRLQAFGARFATNVVAQLGGPGKNPRYVLATGTSIMPFRTGNTQPGHCLIYVVDATSGMFAAYTVPWNRNAERSGQTQSGPLVYVGGGPIRNFQLKDPAQNQPAAVVDPNQKP